VDLSKVMFVCTANSLRLSKPLLDRFEIIEVAGYSREEKAEIARVHLVPQQVRENGVEGLVEFDSTAIEALAARSREPGVRTLQRNIAKVCRKVARANRQEVITKERIEDILGERRKSELWSGVGVAHGLAQRVLTVEAVRFPSAAQQVVVTGQLGEVMRESVDVALSCIRGNF
jgi:ATP-dependent Lon protease